MQEAVTGRNYRNINVNLKKNAEWLYWGWFLVSILAKCFYFQFTTQANIRPFITSDNLRMLLSSFSIVLMVTSLVFMFSNRKRNIVLFIVNFLLITILVADTNFYRYYYNAISIPVFYQFDVTMVSSVDSSIMSLFKVKDILYLADLPVMIALLIYISKKSIAAHVAFKKRCVAGLLVLAVALTGFLGAYVKADRKSFSHDNNYVVKSMGVFYFHLYDAQSFIKEKMDEKIGISAEDKRSIKTFYEKKEKALDTGTDDKYEGIAAGKNLMVVQIEAMQGFVVNREINGKEITPNLNKLLKDSLYFNNIYYQVAGGNTSDAEFLTNTSLYPLKEGAVYHRFPENAYQSTANILKEKGYSTYSAHAFYPTFWNRNEMHKTLGFDKFLNQDDFVMDDFAGWDGASALSDMSFFRQTLDKIDTSKPFYSFLITLSSHHPFEYFKDYDFDVGELQDTYLGNYLKAANYADKSIGFLLEELKKRGLYENTLLAFYGDHSAVPKHQSQELFDFLGSEFSELSWTQLQKVPLIIHGPGLEGGQVINKIGGQIDVLPTIANLMGIEAPYALGKDMLNSSKGYAVLRNGTVITDDFIYLNNLREAYRPDNGELLPEDSYKEELYELQKQLDISDEIIFKNALKEDEKTGEP